MRYANELHRLQSDGRRGGGKEEGNGNIQLVMKYF